MTLAERADEFICRSVQTIGAHIPLLTPELMEQAAAKGKKVFGWTAKRQADMLSALGAGPDAIVTDFHQQLSNTASSWSQKCANSEL